jgi:2-hydroxy-6-oxonona-2,4-dienedioate hydrolase
MIAYPASAGGVLTRVLEAGHGTDVVLFLHGVGSRADRWRLNLEPAACAGFRCLALDLPGHGFAQKGPGFAYGVPGYADFVERFLDERGIENVHLVGSSLGAHVLSTVACRRPGKVRSLVLVGATGMFPIGPEARDRIAGRLLDRSRDGVEHKLKTVIHDSASVAETMIDEEWAINTSPGTEETFMRLAEYFRNSLDDDAVGARLAALTPALPTLLVWGEQDRSVPLAIGLKAQQVLNGAPLRIIPRTAHAPYWEDPQAFNVILLEFLQGLGKKS